MKFRKPVKPMVKRVARCRSARRDKTSILFGSIVIQLGYAAQEADHRALWVLESTIPRNWSSPGLSAGARSRTHYNPRAGGTMALWFMLIAIPERNVMSNKELTASGNRARLSLHVRPESTKTGAATGAKDLAMVPTCLQLKHILVPIDFSERCQKALRYAAKFAEQFGSDVTLLHVIQPVVYPTDFGYPPTVVEPSDDGMRREVEGRLESLAKTTGIPMQPLIRVGQPYHEIATAAEELNVDLIILTTHGRTGLQHVLLGSTAERVVRHAPCPVLTVREREHDFV